MTDSLLSRLSSLTEPSREIDAEIALAAFPWLKDYPRDDRNGDPGWMTKDGRTCPPRYTESFDAAKALRPVLTGPGRGGLWIKMTESGGTPDQKSFWHAELTGIDNDKPLHFWGMHTLAPVALLIALEKAEISEAMMERALQTLHQRVTRLIYLGSEDVRAAPEAALNGETDETR